MSSGGNAQKIEVETVAESMNSKVVELSPLAIESLVRALVKHDASDLHLKPGRPPLFRIHGKLHPAKIPELSAEECKRIVYQLLTPAQIEQFERKRQLDFSFVVSAMGRFRCNVYFQRGQVSAVIRVIPFKIPRLKELNLPPVLKDLVEKRRGLLLVTGPTGSGKSTSLAAMIRQYNETHYGHIITIEDPIEFVHRDSKCTVSQREIGTDALSFEDALVSGLRQDPDVIMIGEMRDYETIKIALTAAETGHLVLATLHTNDARSSIDRIIDIFPADAQNQVRIQLSSVLVGVCSQVLLNRKDGQGRVPACEILVKSPTVEAAIFKNELSKLGEIISSSNTYYHMQSFNMALEALVQNEVVDLAEALKATNNPDDLKLRLAGISREQGYDMKQE